MTSLDPSAAAVWDGVDHGFTIRPQPRPALADGELLVDIELATICGSDLHTVNGDRPTPLPTVLGHEAVGRVVAANKASTAEGRAVTVGDRVTWTIGTSCGSCRRCRRGLPQKCLQVRKYGHEAITDGWRLNGTFGSQIHLLAGTGVVGLPDDLGADVLAPANCATATVTSAARRIQLAADDAVVVLGCGMLGLTAVAYARDRGVGSVIACDVDPSRRQLAARFGATRTVAPSELAEAAAEDGADVIFELSGNSRSVRSAFDIIDLGGRIALVGSVSPAPEVSFEPSGYVKNLTTVVGCHNYRVDDLAEAVAFLTRTDRRAEFAALVSAPYQLSKINTAIEAARAGGHPRVALRPDHR